MANLFGRESSFKSHKSSEVVLHTPYYDFGAAPVKSIPPVSDPFMPGSLLRGTLCRVSKGARIIKGEECFTSEVEFLVANKLDPLIAAFSPCSKAE